MSIQIKMPALSPTMKEGNLSKWHVKNGDKVKIGDLLAEIETDKATMELESDYEGYVDKILYEEGSENIPVGSELASIIEDVGSKLDDQVENDLKNKGFDYNPKENKKENIEVSETNIVKNVSVEKTNQLRTFNDTNLSTKTSRVLASPLAKRLAKQNNIDLTHLKGSGPNGRIIKIDIEKFNKNFKVESPNQYNQDRVYEDKEISSMRKVISQRLSESYQTSPHIYLSIDCNIEKLLEIRKTLNLNTSSKISVNDFIIKASAISLIKIPESNVSWSDNFCRYYKYADISIAVAVPNGLITPIIKNSEKKGLGIISSEVKDLAARAKQGKLSAEEYQGGTFTISNLGMYGIKNFTAIINPPQSMILAIGKAEKRPIVENEEIKIASIMTVTLSCDHRIIDGAIGSEWLKVFKENIENPSLMLL